MSWRRFKEWLGFKRKAPTTIQMKPTRLSGLDRRVAAAREQMIHTDEYIYDARGNIIGKVKL